MARNKIYQFYAVLDDYEPKIWRRFEIDGKKTIAELSYVIMIMFEMQASHLFSLKQNYRLYMRQQLEESFPKELVTQTMADTYIKDVRFEFPYDEVYLKEDEMLIVPNTINLQQSTANTGVTFSFMYDYGDGWEISLILEEVREEEISLSLLPRVTGGEGYGIVEDVGGVGGLTHLVEVLENPSHEEYADFTSWLDSTTLNLSSFDILDCNFRLKKLLRVYRDCYEYHYEPTKASLKLLNRAYLGKGARGY